MKYWLFPLVLFVYLLLHSCSKTTELGLSLVEQEQSDIIFSDTFKVHLNTTVANTSFTNDRPHVVIGAYTDSIFGYVSSEACLNFRLNRTNVDFPNCVFDSLVLTLCYESYGHYGDIKGDAPGLQQWDVFQLSEPILDQDYESDVQLATSQTLKSNFTFTPRFQDSVYVGVDSQLTYPHIRIRLDDAAGLTFGQELLDPTDTTIYNSNNDFKNWFNGVKVQPNAAYPNSSIVRIRHGDPLTKLTLYYRDTSNGGNTAETFDYLTDEDAESISTFEHDYTGTNVLDSTNTDSIVYLQGLDGVYTRVSFPDIEDLSSVIINKAEVVVYLNDTGTTELSEPIQLVAKYLNNASEYQLIDDIVTSFLRVQSYLLFGGVLEKVDDGYIYRIQFAEQFQELIDDPNAEKAIYLTLPLAIDPERITLKNQLSMKQKPILYLTYTNINE